MENTPKFSHKFWEGKFLSRDIDMVSHDDTNMTCSIPAVRLIATVLAMFSSCLETLSRRQSLSSIAAEHEPDFLESFEEETKVCVDINKTK
jgi:hypothetical protein